MCARRAQEGGGQPPPPSDPLQNGAYRYVWRGTLLNRLRDAVRNNDPSAHYYKEWLPSRVYNAIVVGNAPDYYVALGVSPPPDQVYFVNKVFQPLVSEIVGREADLGSRNRYVLLKQAADMLYAGCVSAPADPQAAATQAPGIRKRMEELILSQQSTRLAWSVRKALCLALLLGGAAGWFGYVRESVSVLATHLLLVAAVCLAVDAVSMRGLAAAETMAQYETKKHLLDLPFLRLLLLTIVVELFAILCWKGGIQFRIGQIDSQNLETDPWAAVAIGAAGGFLGSDLTRVLIGAFRKKVGRA